MVDRVEVVADGEWTDVEFEAPIARSSWLALRVMGSFHTMKQPLIREEDRTAAEAAYDHARRIYDEIIAESPVP